MAYHIEDKLVIAVASSALFDLSESDRVYREQGVAAYREYQQAHENDLLAPGAAFPLVKRLLSLNEPSGGPQNQPPGPPGQVTSIKGESGNCQNKDHPVEVVLLSRNDPETGLRAFNSIEGLRTAGHPGCLPQRRRRLPVPGDLQRRPVPVGQPGRRKSRGRRRSAGGTGLPHPVHGRRR